MHIYINKWYASITYIRIIYIYKVRFVTLYNTRNNNIMYKHELIFGKQKQFQQHKKLIANK